MSNRTLVTFFILTYNQERFVREAVESAFAQTYSPLEIILSDDCSTDSTFAIMEEMAARYDGPHELILNRCKGNIGVANHLNLIGSIARGDLLIAGAGDDISMAERTTKIVEAWNRSGRRAISIFTNAKVIDADGKVINGRYFESASTRNPNEIHLMNILGGWSLRICPISDVPECMGNWVLGATHAYHRKTFELFGPLCSGVLQEDIVIALRAQLLGEIVYLDEPLVYYRRHSTNVVPDRPTPQQQLVVEEKMCRQRLPLNANRLADIYTAKAKFLISNEALVPLEMCLREQIQWDEVELLVKEGRRIRALGRGCLHLLMGVRRASFALHLWRRYAPLPVTRQSTKLMKAYRQIKGGLTKPRSIRAEAGKDL